MNFEQVRILEALFAPPNGLIVLGLLGCLLIFTRAGKIVVTLSLICLYLLSTPFVSSWLSYQLEKQYPALDPSKFNEFTKPQILVVLGGGYYGESVEYSETTIGPFFAERVRYAAWIAKKLGLPVIVSSGNTDAQAAARILQEEYKLPEVLVEKSSWTTQDNAAHLKLLLQNIGVTHIGLITHGWHMPRAMWCFQREGLNVLAMPMGLLVHQLEYRNYRNWLPATISLLRSRNAIHEFLGLQWYRFGGNEKKSSNKNQALLPSPSYSSLSS